MKKKLLTLLAVLAMAGMAMAQTAPSDINLHRNDDGTWSFIMPGRNLVMSTETFSSNDPNGHTLAGVPEGWLVIAAGDTVTITDGVTTPITEGAPVTIVPSGNRRAIKSITLVDEFTSVTSITLNKTSTTIYKGSTETLSVTSVLPANATDPTVTWSSSATGVATVNATTGVVTAVAAGPATITATANDGSGVTASCAVTVTIPPISTYLTNGANVTVSFVNYYEESMFVTGTYSVTSNTITDVYSGGDIADDATLSKNGNIIHAWVKDENGNEATLEINVTNNTYTLSFVNNDIYLTGFTITIGGTNVTSLLTLAAD